MAPFRRIAIVNRGEAAVRFLHAVHEYADETGRDYVAIAMHPREEATSSYVRDADESVCFDDVGIAYSGMPYLDLAVLEASLVSCRAEAVWVGWGFVAERPEFADLCARLGLTFIGPSGDVMRLLGDKIGAKLLADKAGVPMGPWSGGAVESVADAEAAAGRVGFPLMVKAAAGGGGRGIRRVERMEDLGAAFESARSEGEKAFGDPTVFLERVITDARHVEVQIIADDHGTVWAPGVRDCSVQRKNQKVLEESASVALPPARVAELKTSAIRLALEAGYRNAGTVEFLYQPEDDLLAFLEVNTRLQVEHTVTEVTCGIDLVKLQIEVAHGTPLGEGPPPPVGHAIEARLNAEDPAHGFAPSPGRIVTLALPSGPGIRVDTGVVEGDEISPAYDSMIAKVIGHGSTRHEALSRLRRALHQTRVVVEGGTTNKSFLLGLLDHADVRAGRTDTGWLDRLTAAGEHTSAAGADVALLAAAIEVHDALYEVALARFLGSAARGRPHLDDDLGVEVSLSHDGSDYRVHVTAGGPHGWYRCAADGHIVDVVITRLGARERRLRIGGSVHRVVTQVESAEVLVDIDGVAHRFSRDDGGLVRAPSVALVVAVAVSVGDTVRAGDRILVVEAMKMETTVVAPVGGVVEEVLVAPNMQVDAGAPLLRIGSAGDGVASTAARLTPTMPSVDRSPAQVCAESLDALHGLFLGFDVDDDTVADVIEAHLASSAVDDPEIGARELDLLRLLADGCSVTRDRRVSSRDERETRSPRGQLTAFLRTFDVEREQLGDRFNERTLRLLSHYGVDSLDPSPGLDRALFHIMRAGNRRALQVRVATRLLERRLDDCGPTEQLDRLRDTLDAVIAACQTDHPALGTLARSIRHRCIDRPLLEVATHAATEAVRAEFRALVVAPDDEAVIEALVNSPIPIVGLAAESGVLARNDTRRALVAALVRRFYKIRDIAPIEGVDGDIVRTRYHHQGRDVEVVAGAGDLADFASVLDRLVDHVTGTADRTVFDCVLTSEPETTIHDVAQIVQLLCNAGDLPASVQRVAVVAAAQEPDPEIHTVTFVRSDEGWTEDVVFRGLHPMVGRRLNLWRLENFDLTRLPSAPDTHLFDCVALDNPQDERLVAVAEVRDITPLRDVNGALIGLPELERVLAACLDGIRQAQVSMPRRQLEWNRVMLYVWPPVTITASEMNQVARRLVPLTRGLGMEQTIVHGRIVDPASGDTADVAVRIGYEATGMTLQVTPAPTEPMKPLDDYMQKVLACRRRGTTYPYELVPLLTTGPEGSGHFEELDLDGDEALVSVDRAPGLNRAAIIIGRATTPTAKHPEGMSRIAIFGDPTKSMGSIAEAECRRLLAAIDLAEAERLPIEWFALSAGARIAMDSGSENLDWVAAVLRRIIEFTQAGGEINIVVAGINVGAQPYWNAEATMLMHTKGILVMTPESAMVLTGKQAIDFSGGVSAEDNLGIGGYERVMGPNGQAQYWAPDLAAAIGILYDHYRHAYVAHGEDGPRPASTDDPTDRDVLLDPHDDNGTGISTIEGIFSAQSNAERKKPFDARSLLRAVVDRDHRHLERWAEMVDAEASIVVDAHLGGHPVTVVGIESRPLPRSGQLPADGPDSWSAGTLFPLSSKKVARAINAASGVRPVVVLANLSGFDGSPESLRRLQLEYGAEIGRSIVNFDGPIVLCVVSRYHGGAFVVFSNRLNDRMQVLAVEGARASVIGGAPAAAVVFTREIAARTSADERIRSLEGAIASAPAADRARLRLELASVREQVRTELLGVVAAEFDAVHSVERAVDVGSVHRVIGADRLRPELIAAVERGLAGTPLT